MVARWLSVMAVCGVVFAVAGCQGTGTQCGTSQPIAPAAAYAPYPMPYPMTVAPGQPMAPTLPAGVGTTWIGSDKGPLPYTVSYQSGEARPPKTAPSSHMSQPSMVWVNTPNGPMLYPAAYHGAVQPTAPPPSPTYYLPPPSWPQPPTAVMGPSGFYTTTPATPSVSRPPSPAIPSDGRSAPPAAPAPVAPPQIVIPAPAPAPVPVPVAVTSTTAPQPQPTATVRKDIWYPTKPGEKDSATDK